MPVVKGDVELEDVEDLTGSHDLKEEDEAPFQFEDLDHSDTREFEEEDSWTVISAHFHERGLVGQQLDSFDNFMTSTMQVRDSLIFERILQFAVILHNIPRFSIGMLTVKPRVTYSFFRIY